MSNMVYNVTDKVPFKKLILFSIQMMLSCFTASALIAQICGVEMSGALIGAGISTIVYALCTKFKSPMFISNSGAFADPVVTAMAAGGYTAIAVGGVVSALVYCLFGFIFSKVSVDKLYKFMPKVLIGAVTVVIGVNLMTYIPSYVAPQNEYKVEVKFYCDFKDDGTVDKEGLYLTADEIVKAGDPDTAKNIFWESHNLTNYPESGLDYEVTLFQDNTGKYLLVAFVTVLVIGLSAHYLKGVLSLFPFLIGTLAGYAVSIPLNLVDFSKFNGISLFKLPTFAFTQWEAVDFKTLIPIIIMYVAFTVSAICECLSDHAALGNIVGVDLYKKPGLNRIFIGEGCANLATSFLGGLGACSYGEGVGTVGFSKCGSHQVPIGAALLLIFMGFFEPVQAFIASIPSAVIGGGTACVLYGFISASGIKVLQQVDLNNQKNLIICSVVMSLGICGIAVSFGAFSLSGTALALVVGVILNLILKDKNEKV